METINIVMAVYNGEAYIREQIESILASTYKNWVLTIYDDGSKDHTEELVREYVSQYPNQIQYVKNEKNLGHMNNFLTGAKKSQYDYVCFSDQDDVWNEDKLEITYHYMKEAEQKMTTLQPVVVFTDAQIVNQDLQELHPSFHQNSQLNTNALDFPHMLMENKMMGCTMMINRKVIDSLEELPVNGRFHDWWIGLIASGLGTIVYAPVATMKYRQHEKNVVGNISFLQYVKKRLLGLKEQKNALHLTILQPQELARS